VVENDQRCAIVPDVGEAGGVGGPLLHTIQDKEAYHHKATDAKQQTHTD